MTLSYQSSAWLGLGVLFLLCRFESTHGFLFFFLFFKMTALDGKRGGERLNVLFFFCSLTLLLSKVCSMYGVFFFSSENSWEVYYANEMS